MFSTAASVHRGWTVPAGPTTRFTDTLATGPPAGIGVTRTPSTAGPHEPGVWLANWSVVVDDAAVNVHSLAFHRGSARLAPVVSKVNVADCPAAETWTVFTAGPQPGSPARKNVTRYVAPRL